MLFPFIGFFLSAFRSAYPKQSAIVTKMGQQRTLDAALRAWGSYDDDDQLELAKWAHERIEANSMMTGEQKIKDSEEDRDTLSEAMTDFQLRNVFFDPYG